MPRRLFTIASALSLVLFVVGTSTAVLTANACYSKSCAFRGGRVEVASGHGRIAFARVFRSPADFWMGGLKPTENVTAHWLPIDRQEIGYFMTASSLSADGRNGNRSTVTAQPRWVVHSVQVRVTELRGGAVTAAHSLSYYSILYWPLLLALLMMPASRFVVGLYRASLREQRVVRELCPVCGYDLRATPDQCPECRTAVATAPAM